MKRDLVNGGVDGWSVNVSANTGTGRSQYVNAGELSGSTSSHEGLNKLINIRYCKFIDRITYSIADSYTI
ncbi:hypothetical protein S83_048355, partial [Arachis hypogaea]